MEPTSTIVWTVARSEAELTAAISTDARIIFGNDIALNAAGSTSSVFTISGVTGLVIDGAGHTLGFSSSSSSNGRIFSIGSSSEVELKNLTLTNGYVYSSSSNAQGGAIFCDDSILVMISCDLSSNTVYASWAYGGYGGALYSSGDSEVTMYECAISDNAAAVSSRPYGGAIFAQDGKLVMTSCDLSGNTATSK